MKITLQTPYKEDWKFGYLVINPENRRTVILFNNKNNRSSVSYARYQLAIKLQRYLTNNEFVDHIDNDKTNDDINNLQILTRKENNLKSNKGIDGDRDDLRLGSIYIWARELAKKYCPVIVVCQSDATGEGKRWLTMDNVANAKTAKQAEADWIIGIGKTHNESEEHLRYLSICKNKLIGDSDTESLVQIQYRSPSNNKGRS